MARAVRRTGGGERDRGRLGSAPPGSGLAGRVARHGGGKIDPARGWVRRVARGLLDQGLLHGTGTHGADQIPRSGEAATGAGADQWRGAAGGHTDSVARARGWDDALLVRGARDGGGAVGCTGECVALRRGDDHPGDTEMDALKRRRLMPSDGWESFAAWSGFSLFFNKQSRSVLCCTAAMICNVTRLAIRAKLSTGL